LLREAVIDYEENAPLASLVMCRAALESVGHSFLNHLDGSGWHRALASPSVVSSFDGGRSGGQGRHRARASQSAALAIEVDGSDGEDGHGSLILTSGPTPDENRNAGDFEAVQTRLVHLRLVNASSVESMDRIRREGELAALAAREEQGVTQLSVPELLAKNVTLRSKDFLAIPPSACTAMAWNNIRDVATILARLQGAIRKMEGLQDWS
jgi:hypothetical protein